MEKIRHWGDTSCAMPKRDQSKFKQWVAREVQHLRQSYSFAHGGMSQEAFAAHCGLSWKTISNIENQVHWPGINVLYQIVNACDSTLAEFFAKLVTRSELSTIEMATADETQAIAVFVRALSNPQTRQAVLTYADLIAGLMAESSSQ